MPVARPVARLVALLLLPLLAACVGQSAPAYAPSAATTAALSASGVGKANVGPIADGPDARANPRELSIRHRPFTSPYDNSFATYVRTALRLELSQAGAYDPASRIVVTGTLLANDLDATGVNIGTADMTVRFVVSRAGRQVYDRTITRHHEWESAFGAIVAIPAAMREYGAMVQLLLRDLLTDPAFIAATKPGADVAGRGGIAVAPLM